MLFIPLRLATFHCVYLSTPYLAAYCNILQQMQEGGRVRDFITKMLVTERV